MLKKEILTQENCQRDLLHRLKMELLAAAVTGGGLLLFSGFFTLVIALLNRDIPWAGTPWLIAALWVLPAIYVPMTVYHGVAGYRRIRRAAFSVEEAKLNNITELEIRRFRLFEPWHFRRIRYRYDRYVFYFSSYGRYVLPEQSFRWSETFRMSDSGLNNYSGCGDDFYLLVYTEGSRKGKVAYAYPAKLFQWDGAVTAESIK